MPIIDEGDEIKNIFNTVVASPRVVGEGYCGGFSTHWYLNEFVDFILSESATMIYLPYIEVIPFESDFENLSEIAKNHIKIVDQKKSVFNEIREIIVSISNEINYSVQNKDHINYSLDRLLQYLYRIKLAKEYKSEADISRIHTFREDVLYIFDNTTNKEVKTLLSEIVGFFNCYKPQSIETSVFKAKLPPDTLDERFKQIMKDFRYLDLSKKNIN